MSPPPAFAALDVPRLDAERASALLDRLGDRAHLRLAAARADEEVVGNALELGENNRFRFVVDPLCVALLGRLITERLHRRGGAIERGR